ncbi:MAG: ATP-binding protein [bacterium]
MKLSRLIFTRLFVSIFIVQLLTVSVTGWFILRPFIDRTTQFFVEQIKLQIDVHQNPVRHKMADTNNFISIRDGIVKGRSYSSFIYLHILGDALAKQFGRPVELHITEHQQYPYWFVVTDSKSPVSIGLSADFLGTQPPLSMALMLLFNAAFSFISSLILTAKMERPIKKMVSGTAAVSKGEFDTRLMPTDIEELDELICHFNRMSEKIHSMIEYKTTLLAGVSHDLRTPLTRMKLAIAIQENKIPNSTRERLERYLTEMENLLSLFLGDSNLNSKELCHRLSSTDIIQQLIVDQPSTIQIDFIAEPQFISSNPLALKRVLGNLIDNACKYTRHKVKIWQTSDDTELRIHIRDNGPGLSELQIQTAFDPFQRFNQNADGHGLGLAIVKQISEAMHWTVLLKAAPNTGIEAILRIKR